MLPEPGAAYLLAALALLAAGGVLAALPRRAYRRAAVAALVLVVPLLVAYVVERERQLAQRCERLGGHVERDPQNSKLGICVRDGLVVRD